MKKKNYRSPLLSFIHVVFHGIFHGTSSLHPCFLLDGGSKKNKQKGL
jgi:hypothetical protein